MHSRRDFLKRSCTLCIGLSGVSALLTQATGCAGLPVYKTATSKGIVEVPLSAFTDKSRLLILKNPQFEYDIALVKKTETDFSAFQMKCTHQDNALTATQTGFFCASHGSAFDMDGKVTQEPALSDLRKYPTEIKENVILIHTIS
jgi:Rieske Fe-S protein